MLLFWPPRAMGLLPQGLVTAPDYPQETSKGSVGIPGQLTSRRLGSVTHSPHWEVAAEPEGGGKFLAPHPGKAHGVSVQPVAGRLYPGSWDRQTGYKQSNTS